MQHIFNTFLAITVLTIINCSHDSPVVPEPESGSLKVSVHLSEVGRLAKRTVINLEYCQIKLFASEEDTIVDSLPLSGNGQASLATIFPGLVAGKEWTVSVTSFDINDSTIHYGTTNALVIADDTTVVTLNIAPAFSMLRANFFPIRDSVDRIELKVDGGIKDDSLFLAQALLGDTLTLSYDYLPANGNLGFVHHIELGAYGVLNGERKLLYYGDTSIQVYPSMNTSLRLSLFWTGDTITPPDTTPGALTMQVVLGTIATVNINGEMIPDTASTTLPGSLPTVTMVHGSASNVQVSGNYASWRSGIQVMLYDGSTVQQISNNTANPDKIVMKDNKVAWEIHDGTDNEIYYYNGSTTIRLTDNNADDRISLISDSVVVWYSHDGNDNELYCSILGDTTIQLTNNSVNDYAAACKGTRIFWRASDGNDDEIFWYNGDSVQQLTSNTTNDFPLGMCNYDFLWSNSSTGGSATNSFNGTVTTTLFNYSSSIARDSTCDSVVFLRVSAMSSYEYYKINATGMRRIWTGSTADFPNSKVLSNAIAINSTMVAPYDLFFCNQDTSHFIMSSNYYFNSIDFFNNSITWSQSDGHDSEIFYKNGFDSLSRVTSNNGDDSQPYAVPGGVIFRGTADNGETGWVYWNGSTIRRFTTISFGAVYHFGNGFLTYNSVFPSTSAIYRIEF